MEAIWRDIRIFVTGASGFIGSHLLRRLCALGAEVHIAIRPQSSLLRIEDLCDKIETHQLTLSCAAECHALFEQIRPEFVLNFAAAGVLDPEGNRECIQQNVLSSMTLLNAAERACVRRFIQAGSCFEYGAGKELNESSAVHPTNFYAISKLASSLLARNFNQYGLPVVVLRIFTPYGPGEAPSRLISSTISKAMAGESIAATLGEQRRDFIYIDDLVDGILAACSSESAPGRVINLGSGTSHTVREVIETILRLCNSKSAVDFGALPYRSGEMFENSADVSLAKRILGWEAHTSLETGLKRTIEAARAKRSF